MYRLERFGTITLPIYNNEYTTSPVSARLSLIATTAGSYDMDGSGRNAQDLPFPISYSGIVWEDTAGANRAALDALRAAVGTRANLYRRAADNDVVHSCVARLVAAPQVWPYTMRGWFEVELNFQQMSRWKGAWHAPWTLDSGVILDEGWELDESDTLVALDTNPKTISVINGGNLPVNDAVFTITAAGTTITYVEVTGTNIDFQWIGTLAAGTSLVIDSGRFSVENNGTNAYHQFSLGANHKLEHWLEIQPGSNALTIERVGGSAASTVNVFFRDGWA